MSETLRYKPYNRSLLLGSEISEETELIKSIAVNTMPGSSSYHCECNDWPFNYDFKATTHIILKTIPSGDHLYQCNTLKLIRQNKNCLKSLQIGTADWKCKKSFIELMDYLFNQDFVAPQLQHLKLYEHPQNIEDLFYNKNLFKSPVIPIMPKLCTLECNVSCTALPYLLIELSRLESFENAVFHTTENNAIYTFISGDIERTHLFHQISCMKENNSFNLTLIIHYKGIGVDAELCTILNPVFTGNHFNIEYRQYFIESLPRLPSSTTPIR